MMKKILSAALALCLACTVFTSMAFAKSSFSDVISPDYDWAAEEIEEMTVLGIIKGYTDGTFRPAISVKKIEALLFMARAAGFESVDYDDFVNFASTLYANVLDEYDLGAAYEAYKDEVAFLLYKGVLGVDDLEDYLEKPASALKRYEAAILLTKLMGAEEDVKKNTAVVLDYSDYTDIPASARAYVEYVSDEGLMKGLEDNTFAPNDDVTRVQMTLLLNRVLKALDYTTKLGTVKEVDSKESTVRIYDEENKKSEDYSINTKKVSVKKDGFKANLSDIAEDSTVLLLYSGKDLVGVEVLSSVKANEKTAGRLADITRKTDYTTFSLVDDKTSDIRNFVIPADAEPKVTHDGKAAEFGKLSEGDYVTLTLENGAITAIDAESGDRTVTGTISEITLTPDYSITVRLSDNGTSTNETADFDVSDDVSVVRNSEKSSLRDLLAGDRVTLTVKGGIVTKIVASSTKKTAKGAITSILISSSPKLGVREDGEETVYSIASDADFTVGGKEADIYSLRLGANVELAVEGDSVTAVTATAASTTHQKTGIISDINTSYGFINLDVDGASEQILVAKTGSSVSATIVDSATGKSLAFTKLQAGQMITAVGSYVNGSFVATTIVVIPVAE